MAVRRTMIHVEVAVSVVAAAAGAPPILSRLKDAGATASWAQTAVATQAAPEMASVAKPAGGAAAVVAQMRQWAPPFAGMASPDTAAAALAEAETEAEAEAAIAAGLVVAHAIAREEIALSACTAAVHHGGAAKGRQMALVQARMRH